MNTRYPLATSSWDDKEINAIHQVIAKDWYTMGPAVAAYERQFADYFGARHCVMTSSGSTANLLMVAAAFFTKDPLLQRGDEVIVPAVSWSTTYFPLQQYGLKLVFCDIDKDTLNIDLDQLQAVVSDRTKAIMLVNLLGNPVDMERINEIIGNRRDIVIFEDNCESMGASFDGHFTGTFGLMGTFSSFFSHHISTMEGGCVLTDSDEVYHILLALRAHGWTRNLPQTNTLTGVKSSDPFEESFKFVLPGYNVRPLEMSGAIGSVQLSKLPKFLETRRANAREFQALFDHHPHIAIQREVGESSWFGFALTIKPGAPFDRATLLLALREAGIESRPVVTGNFLKNKEVLRHFDFVVAPGGVPNAEYLDAHSLFVGNHQIPLKEELQLLRGTIDTLG